MKIPKVYNLQEFAACHHLQDVFGAYAAYFITDGLQEGALSYMVGERTLFTKFLLVVKGEISLNVMHDDDGDDLPGHDSLRLKEGDMLVVSPLHLLELVGQSADWEAECILVDERFHADIIYSLSADKLQAALNIFHLIRDVIKFQYVNKVEMMRSMVNVLQLFVAELPYEHLIITHDLPHKANLYEVFLHQLYRNFRTQRQIRFYADQLNVSPAYLSRMVKEVSGSTINEHISSLLYKEICNLLRQTDLTMGEIADRLNFSDQSALSNFFKSRSGISPMLFRKRV